MVYDDTNGAGVRDPDEPGIENVTVELLDSNGDVAGTATRKRSFSDAPVTSRYRVRMPLVALSTRTSIASMSREGIRRWQTWIAVHGAGRGRHG